MRTLVIRELNAVLKDVDCLLSPVAPTTAYKIGEKTMSPLEMMLKILLTSQSVFSPPSAV